MHSLAIPLSLIACSTNSDVAAPHDSTIDLIEAKLADHPCIADLNEWERNYRFAKSSGLSAYTAGVDREVVEFHLRRTGTVEIHPRRNVLRRGDLNDWPDGPYVQSVDGQFDMGTHVLRMPRCNRTATARKM